MSKKTLKQIVSNRVKEIPELTHNYTWRYCPTDSNRADLFSRGISAQNFKSNSLWMQGLDWLPNEENWPNWNEDQSSILTTISDHTSIQIDTKNMAKIGQISSLMDIHQFSSLGNFYV